MARPKLPQILVASDLLEGDVVYYGADGWIRDHRGAQVAHSAEQTAALEAIGKSEVAANRVVEVTLIDVEVKPDGTPEPCHYRERLRTLGPSTRPDLGKQAGRRER